jgi:lipopolysaccharide export system permease protein
MVLPIPEKPADFLMEQREARQLNLVELSTYIHQLERNGADDHKEKVIFYSKFATPFGCLIMILLAIPWGWNIRKYTGVMINFGLSALVAFFYIGGMQVGQHLGEIGSIPPFLGAWLANLVFAVLGGFFLIRKNQ